MDRPLVLGLETSGPRSAVGLLDAGGFRREFAREGTGHDEVLLGLVDRALAEAGAGLDAVGLIGVTAGPGMFTSLRVGLATALGLGLPRAIPLKAVGTLAALARAADQSSRVLALVDARRGQVYCALHDGPAELLPPRLIEPSGLAGLIRPLITGPTVAAGSGVQLCLAALDALGIADTGIRHPGALAVAELARDMLAREGPDRPEDLVPRYLRRTDAELNRERQDGSGPPA
ncbi:MAG: tRNA (adenosine(37)-N6)-threonylcarbamoyltransferase complex dimerization subunit type 1 TsaB [bacterium]